MHTFCSKNSLKRLRNKYKTVPLWAIRIFLFRLQVGILMSDVGDARAILPGIEVMMTHDHSAGIALVEFLE